jgi:hypothetical protein
MRRIGPLVLAAHVGPRPPGEVARHLNDDGLDDRLVNLAWGPPDANYRDSRLNDRILMGEKCTQAVLTEKEVLEIRAAAASQHTLARQYEVSVSTINQIMLRKTWKHI